MEQDKSIKANGTFIIKVSETDLDKIKRIMLDTGKYCKLMYPDAEFSFGWCTDCKEYDQKAHCCHRFSTVIKEALDGLQLVRCRDCKFYINHDKRCKVWNHGVEEYEYCYRGWKE